MVNPVAQILMTNETRLGASLQVVQLSQNGMSEIVFLPRTNVSDNLKLFIGRNSELRKTWLCHWVGCLVYLKSYQNTLLSRMKSENSISIRYVRVNFSFQSLVRLRRDYCWYQRYTEQNQPQSRKDIYVWWKLYKSNLGEYRYTSLKLDEQLGTIRANPRANFLASNPVRIVRGKNNKEQCHIWASLNSR